MSLYSSLELLVGAASSTFSAMFYTHVCVLFLVAFLTSLFNNPCSFAIFIFSSVESALFSFSFTTYP